MIAFYIALMIFFTGIIYIVLNGVAMVKLIMKAAEKKSPEFLADEKLMMIDHVEDLKRSLANWKDYGITGLSDYIHSKYIKALVRKYTGRLMAYDNSPIIAFQRLERGFGSDGKIVAMTTDFYLYYEYKDNDVFIYYDDKYFGKIEKQYEIFDSSNNLVGTADRSDNLKSYSVVIKGREVASVGKGRNTSSFRKNPFYNDDRRMSDNNPMFIEVDPDLSGERVCLSDEANEGDIKWVTAICIFETVYYGFSF